MTAIYIILLSLSMLLMGIGNYVFNKKFAKQLVDKYGPYIGKDVSDNSL